MSDLANILATVEAKYRSAGAYQAMEYPRAQEQGRKLVEELVAELGAKVKDGSELAMTLAGVRTTCTSGRLGLISNWMGAAKRKLARDGAQ